MSYTWVDGEVITAEKLNEISKEPLFLKEEDAIEGKVCYTTDTGEEGYIWGSYYNKDLSKYMDLYYFKSTTGEIGILPNYRLKKAYPCDTSLVAKDEKCIIKETKILEFYGNYELYIVDDTTAIADGTKQDAGK